MKKIFLIGITNISYPLPAITLLRRFFWRPHGHSPVVIGKEKINVLKFPHFALWGRNNASGSCSTERWHELKKLVFFEIPLPCLFGIKEKESATSIKIKLFFICLRQAIKFFP